MPDILAGLGNFSMAGAIDIIVKVGVALGIIAVIAIAGYFWLQNRKFNINVMIRSVRRGGPKIIIDRGAIVSAQGVEAFRLKKLGKVLPLPNFDIFETGIKGESYVQLFQNGEKELYFLKPFINLKDKTFELEPQERNMLAWYVHAKNLIKETLSLESFFAKYGSHIITIILIMGVVIVISVLLRQLEPIVNGLAGVSKSLTEVAKLIHDSGVVENAGSTW